MNEWMNEWMNGTFTDTNGTVLHGTSENHLITGFGTENYTNGNFLEGNYEEGEKSGLGKFTRASEINLHSIMCDILVKHVRFNLKEFTVNFSEACVSVKKRQNIFLILLMSRKGPVVVKGW